IRRYWYSPRLRLGVSTAVPPRYPLVLSTSEYQPVPPRRNPRHYWERLVLSWYWRASPRVGNSWYSRWYSRRAGRVPVMALNRGRGGERPIRIFRAASRPADPRVHAIVSTVVSTPAEPEEG